MLWSFLGIGGVSGGRRGAVFFFYICISWMEASNLEDGQLIRISNAIISK